MWLHSGEKKLGECLLVLAQYTNVTDRRTDRRTPHDSIDRAYAGTARQKLLQLSYDTFSGSWMKPLNSDGGSRNAPQWGAWQGLLAGLVYSGNTFRLMNVVTLR